MTETLNSEDYNRAAEDAYSRIEALSRGTEVPIERGEAHRAQVCGNASQLMLKEVFNGCRP